MATRQPRGKYKKHKNNPTSFKPWTEDEEDVSILQAAIDYLEAHRESIN